MSAVVVLVDARAPPLFVEATALFIEHCQQSLATTFLMRFALRIDDSISVYCVNDERASSIECESQDIRAQLHALARLAPSASVPSSPLAALVHDANLPSDAASLLFVTPTMPSESEAAALLAAVRGKARSEFTLLVVDLGIQVVGSGDLAALLSLMAAETVATATLCSLARTPAAALSDALVSHAIAKSPQFALGEYAIALSCDVALQVQVRRAFAPPLHVAAARACRCHHVPAAMHDGRAYCTRSAQIDRFDVLECVDVGGKLVGAGGDTPPLAADARVVGPLMARALVPIDMARIGGCDASAALVVVPHVPARETDDLVAAMAAAASNGERFAALVERLIGENQWLVVRAGDDRLLALAPRSGGAALTMHEYLPPPSLVHSTAAGKQPTADGGEDAKRALNAAVDTLCLAPPIDVADVAFGRWRQEHALGPLMQARASIAAMDAPPASIAAVAAASLVVARAVLTKKRRLQRAKLNA